MKLTSKRTVEAEEDYLSNGAAIPILLLRQSGIARDRRFDSARSVGVVTYCRRTLSERTLLHIELLDNKNTFEAQVSVANSMRTFGAINLLLGLETH